MNKLSVYMLLFVITVCFISMGGCSKPAGTGATDSSAATTVENRNKSLIVGVWEYKKTVNSAGESDRNKSVWAFDDDGTFTGEGRSSVYISGRATDEYSNFSIDGTYKFKGENVIELNGQSKTSYNTGKMEIYSGKKFLRIVTLTEDEFIWEPSGQNKGVPTLQFAHKRVK